MENIKTKTAGWTPAVIISSHQDIAREIIRGQEKCEWVLKVKFLDGTHGPFLIRGAAARSLFYLKGNNQGLTRAEALSEHFILSLTQHVHALRHDCHIDIFTERVLPRGYARYHLITPLSLQILVNGRK